MTQFYVRKFIVDKVVYFTQGSFSLQDSLYRY